MKTSLSALVVGAGLVAVAGCGGSKTVAPDPTAEIGCLVNGITLTPSTAVIHPGDSIHVLAIYTPCFGLPRTVAMQWRSSRASAATVDPLDGEVRAYTRGQATIIANDPHDPAVSGAMALVVE